MNVRSASFCWDSVTSAAPWQLDYFPVFSPLCPLQSQPPIFSSFSLSAFLSALCHCYFYTSPFMWGSVERSQPHGSNQRGWMSWRPSAENCSPACQSELKTKHNKQQNKNKNLKMFKFFLTCHWLSLQSPFPHATVHLWQTALARNSPVIAPRTPEQRQAEEPCLECGRLLPNTVRGCKWTVPSWKCASHTDVMVNSRYPPHPPPSTLNHVLFPRHWTRVVMLRWDGPR